MKKITPIQRYPFLRFIASLLVAFGIVIIVCGFVVGPTISTTLYKPVINYLPSDQRGYQLPPATKGDGTSIIIAFVIILITSLVGGSLIANGEMIFLFIDMQANTSIIMQLVQRNE
jgi:hypothetical protein